jgi:hypothetical protein
VDAAILHWLDGTGDLHDTTRSFLGIGVGARLGAFHVLRSSFANSARASFLAVSRACSWFIFMVIEARPRLSSQ